jgi:molecular chaperone DnaK
VEIHVLQGEREMTTYNKSLGKFQLTGIPAAPRGIPQIEVTFDIDANGILSVSAKDLGTGVQQKIEIKAGGGLSDDEIKTMVQDAEAHAEDDKRLRELAETRNEAEQVAYQAEKQLTDLAEQLSDDDKTDITKLVADVREATKGEDTEAIKTALEALQTRQHSISEKLYAQAQEAAAQQQEAPVGGGSGGDDEVVDAEIVDEGK